MVAARKALSGRSGEVPGERLESLEIVLVGGPEIELKLNKSVFLKKSVYKSKFDEYRTMEMRSRMTFFDLILE